MEKPEFLLITISIVMTLGLADLLTSVRNLIRNSSRVRWHWLPLFWAFIVFVFVIQSWWVLYTMIEHELWENYFGFLFLFFMYVVLYMLCSLALPDEVPEKESLDLKAFYMAPRQRHWFYGLFICYIFLAYVSSYLRGIESGVDVHAARGAGVALMFSLLLTRRTVYHSIVSFIILGLTVYFIAHYTLML